MAQREYKIILSSSYSTKDVKRYAKDNFQVHQWNRQVSLKQ
jgi:hypothetical protein